MRHINVVIREVYVKKVRVVIVTFHLSIFNLYYFDSGSISSLEPCKNTNHFLSLFCLDPDKFHLESEKKKVYTESTVNNFLYLR